MKNNIFKILSVFLAITVLFTACQPEKFELGSVISKNDLKFSITQDTDDPNMIILESQNPGFTPMWTTPAGRSTRVKDTVRFAFPGAYEFQYGVQSAGGFIKADVITIDVTTTNLSYVNDELWTMLTGGAGNEKTWIADNGNYGKKQGFYSCFADDALWEDMGQDAFGNYYAIDKSWWEPSNSDIGNTDEDLASYMTFSLEGGAFLKVGSIVDGALVESNSGTFDFSSENKTIEASDVEFAHAAWAHGNSLSWSKGFVVLMLTEDVLMIGNLRDEALSGEDACLYVWNFVSKEYADNYVPEDLPDPEPTLPDGWFDDVSINTNSQIKWILSPENPFNWANLDGSLMNEGWNSPSDYPDWSSFNADIPATYQDFSLIMNSDDGSVVYTAPDGTEISGSYTLDEDGIYTFEGVTPSFNICGNLNFATTAENQWRILSIEKDALGSVTGMWVGARDPEKSEYMAYHLLAQTAGGGTNPADAVKELLCAKTWKLDSERSYDVSMGDWSLQGPVVFSDYATWAWNPSTGDHYASGEAGIDYGSVKFELNGTVTVNQRKRVYTYDDGGVTTTRDGQPEEGDVLASDEIVTLNGIWVLDLESNTISMSVGMLHPWTADFAVADWGALTIYQIQENSLVIQELRDPDLSGEDAFQMGYIYVPE